MKKSKVRAVSENKGWAVMSFAEGLAYDSVNMRFQIFKSKLSASKYLIDYERVVEVRIVPVKGRRRKS